MVNFLETLRDYENRGLIYSQVHPTLPLIIWNYSVECQYGGIYWDEVTLQCRALVTDIDGNIISRGFNKFFNIEEEKHEATQNFEIFEKLDGQYISCFWYQGEMIVNSKGSFTSPYAVEAKRILEEKYPNFQKSTHGSRFTYVFELIGFEQIVVNYPKPDLIVTGIFDIDGTEINIRYRSNVCGVQVVQRFDGLDWKNIKQLNWENSEGFVVRFSNGQRCKIKFENYIELHRVMTNQTTGQIWRALANGEPVSSYLEDTPDEFYDKIREVEREFKERFDHIEEISKIYFDYFKPLLDHDRKLFIDKVNSLLINPYRSVVKSLVDSKLHDEIIWRSLKPKRSQKI